MAPTLEYRDDDAGYLRWLAEHPAGYVINIQHSYNGSDARLHSAACAEITGRKYPGKALTASYVKRCAADLHDLLQWASATVPAEVSPCGSCRPTTLFVAPQTTAHTAPFAEADDAAADTAPPRPGHFTIQRLSANDRHVVAWADDYIRFESRPPWQDRLRAEIRNRCSQLEPGAGEVLHATFAGVKHPNADIENLVLYNIDTFKAAGRNGIRFEHGPLAPPAPDGAEYPFSYRYSLALRESGFNDWRPGRELASFGWVEVGGPKGTPTLAQIWLALSRSPDRTPGLTRTLKAPFALRVEVRPPRGRRPVWGGLVKAVFDGVICAHQAHTDTTNLPLVAERIAALLGEDPLTIAELLLDQRNAVIGVVPRLVKPFGKGVQWLPSDEMCLAGEVLPADANAKSGAVEGAPWAIRGQIVEITPAGAPR